MENIPKSGRPIWKIIQNLAHLNDVQIRSVVRNVKKNPAEGAVKISVDISATSGTDVSASTILGALHVDGLHGRLPRRKPLVSKVNKKRRLEFAKKSRHFLLEKHNF